MWQTKYPLAIPKNLGVGVNFRPCSEGYFLSGRPQSVSFGMRRAGLNHSLANALYTTQYFYYKVHSLLYGLPSLQNRCMKTNFQHVGGLCQAVGAAYFLKLRLLSALKRLNLFFTVGKETHRFTLNMPLSNESLQTVTWTITIL